MLLNSLSFFMLMLSKSINYVFAQRDAHFSLPSQLLNVFVLLIKNCCYAHCCACIFMTVFMTESIKKWKKKIN